MAYGIMTEDGKRVLCCDPRWVSAGPLGLFFEGWSRSSRPVMKESALEIDQLLQECMVEFGDYGLKVFRFTEDDEAILIMNKLGGY